MLRHGAIRGWRVCGGNRFNGAAMLLAVHLRKFNDADAAIGAAPLSLPDRAAARTREVAQECGEEQVAGDTRDRLVVGIVRPFAGGSASWRPSFFDAPAHEGKVLVGSAKRCRGRPLGLERIQRLPTAPDQGLEHALRW